jgi:hypothetical protein
MSFAGTARFETFVHLEFSCVVLISLREDFRWAGCMFPLFYLQNESFIAIKVRPEENDGVKLFTAMNSLEDASHIVPILGTLEGP